MRDITPKQQETLDLIFLVNRYVGRTPSIRELQRLIGLSSVSATMQRVRALRTKGALSPAPGQIALSTTGMMAFRDYLQIPREHLTRQWDPYRWAAYVSRK